MSWAMRCTYFISLAAHTHHFSVVFFVNPAHFVFRIFHYIFQPDRVSCKLLINSCRNKRSTLPWAHTISTATPFRVVLVDERGCCGASTEEGGWPCARMVMILRCNQTLKRLDEMQWKYLRLSRFNQQILEPKLSQQLHSITLQKILWLWKC